MLSIALIGFGVMGREHVACIGAYPRCSLAAVVDPSEVAAAWAEANGVPYFADMEELLATQRFDAAIVATPNDLHVPLTTRLLDAGVPVLLEKPVAGSLAAGEELVRKQHATGVPVLVGHHRRHSAAIRAAQRYIAEGGLGRIVAVNAVTLFHKPDSYFEAEWRRGAAGGPVLINLVHDIDTLRHLCGEIVGVKAMSTSRNRGFEAEDTAAVLLEFASGALGTMLVSDAAVAASSWEHTSGENSAYPREMGQDCIFIAGSRGSLAVPTMRTWSQQGEPSWFRPFEHGRLAMEESDPVALQLEHFCDVIERRVTPLVGVADALRSLGVALAVRGAAGQAKPPVPPLDRLKFFG